MSTPNLKFEHSPSESLADSFVSTPGTQYPSLFAGTMNPSEAMTPQSIGDSELMFGSNQPSPEVESPTPEKKPTKKRKSWGQQLPEPKTNLPPRKRAKTEDEKEQRRVERVLRNRRAAQSSRERKRLEVEALEAEKRRVEQINRDLELRLADMEAKNLMLQRELEQFTGLRSTVSSPHHPEQFNQTPTPVTFSQELFGSQDAKTTTTTTQPSVDSHSVESTVRTVNPASLSPKLRPIVESSSNASSSDMTQHPAAMFFDSDNDNDLSNPSTKSMDNVDYTSYFDLPHASSSDHLLLENGILPLADSFDLNYDHMAGDHDGVLDDFNINDFLHGHDDLIAQQTATDFQSSDSLAETTAILQPPFGASSYGCDDGGNAVIDRENQQRSKESEARDGSTNVAAEVRQACGELDAMFRQRRKVGDDDSTERVLRFPLSRAGDGGGIVGTTGQKSLGDYGCPAFDQRDRN
ncbi:hypothetical protein B7463_g10365, partial [Scytalidium lignicola]